MDEKELKSTVTQINRSPALGRLTTTMRNAVGLAMGPSADEVLRASSIVLMCAGWEAFLEDSVLEMLDHVAGLVDVCDLPVELKKAVVRDLGKNELGAWELAGDNWRQRARAVVHRHAEKLHTPNFAHTTEYLGLVGLRIEPSGWAVDWNEPEPLPERLDRYIIVRHQIAHRGTAAAPVTKEQCKEFFETVSAAASVVIVNLYSECRRLTGSTPYDGHPKKE